MPATERVTVTLPSEMLDSIDRLERNRSRFITQAVALELLRRRREALLRSLQNPHAEAVALADTGLAGWAEGLPSGDEGLVDLNSGTPARWIPGRGWVEDPA